MKRQGKSTGSRGFLIDLVCARMHGRLSSLCEEKYENQSCPFALKSSPVYYNLASGENNINNEHASAEIDSRRGNFCLRTEAKWRMSYKYKPHACRESRGAHWRGFRTMLLINCMFRAPWEHVLTCTARLVCVNYSLSVLCFATESCELARR